MLASLRKTIVIVRIIVRIRYEEKMLVLFFFFFNRQLKTDKFDEITLRERKRFGAHGCIDLWREWISEVYRARWRCFTIEDNAQKTIRQFQTAFLQGINRPSFKPSALFVLPFLNPARHHPVQSGHLLPMCTLGIEVRSNYSNYRGLA